MLKFKNLFCILLLAVSTYAATLNCIFYGKICPAFNLTVTQVNEPITVTGAPFTPYTDTNTTTLTLALPSHVISQFPTKLFDIFPKVQLFSAENISSTGLGTDSFYNCDKLTYISIYQSNLGSIGPKIASACMFVTSFYAQNSQVTSIDENAFQGMISLRDVDLSNNLITCIPPLLFQNIKGINNINLNNNKITAIHSQLFAGAIGFSNINLDYNLITYIPLFNLDNIGNGYVQSQSISFCGDPIAAIHPSLLTYLYDHRKTGSYFNLNFFPHNWNFQTPLPTCITPTFDPNSSDLYVVSTWDWIQKNISYTYATTCYSAFTPTMASDSLVTCGSIVTTTSTTSTTLNPNGGSGNGTGSGSGSGSGTGSGGQCATDKVCRYYLGWNNTYTCVIDGAEGTVTSITGTHYLTYVDTDVTRLYFINSHLNLVPSILFTKFPNLKYLHIANSGMSVINNQTFNQCGNLELLDVSHNQITHVEETALQNCTKLRIVDLTGNPIDYVGGKLYQLDPSLEKIHLTRLEDWILA